MPVQPNKNDRNTGLREHSAPRAGWYILRCGAGTEFEADKALRNSGWSTFLPVETKWRAGYLRRRPVPRAYPRFPGYLFLYIRPPAWPNFGAWPFVVFIHGILCMGGTPLPLAPGEIERLMHESGKPVPHVASVPVHRALQSGQRVRVVAGPFRDFTAQVAIDDSGARITVQLFGRPTEIPVPLTWLEAA